MTERRVIADCQCDTCRNWDPEISTRRPIPHTASPRNRARWTVLETLGWRAIRRNGTGSWMHPHYPHCIYSTAAALAESRRHVSGIPS